MPEVFHRLFWRLNRRSRRNRGRSAAALAADPYATVLVKGRATAALALATSANMLAEGKPLHSLRWFLCSQDVSMERRALAHLVTRPLPGAVAMETQHQLLPAAERHTVCPMTLRLRNTRLRIHTTVADYVF